MDRATADEGAERAHPHAGEIHIRGQDPGQRGQIHGHGLLPVGGQKVGVAIGREFQRRSPCDRFNVLHLEPLKRALEIEGRPFGLDRGFGGLASA